jgi:hypothetical protein
MQTASPMMGVSQRAMNTQTDTVSARQANMQNEGLGSSAAQIPLSWKCCLGCWASPIMGVNQRAMNIQKATVSATMPVLPPSLIPVADSAHSSTTTFSSLMHDLGGPIRQRE